MSLDRGAMRRSTRRRKWIVFAIVGLIAALAIAASVPVLSGLTAPPRVARDAAQRAVDAARTAAARTWAPERLRAAEQTLRAALAETRRQEVRLLPLRNFEKSRDGFAEAERLAREARLAAEATRIAAHDDAAAALTRARDAVLRVDRATRGLRIGPGEQAALRTARIRLGEAESLHAIEDHVKARARAEAAEREAERAGERVSDRAARYTDGALLAQWRTWKRETIAWSARHRAPAIVVNKDQNLVTLYDRGRLVRTYRGDMGMNHFERKLSAGDNATPEGRYRIVTKKDRGQSIYHRALEIDYPNAADRERFQEARKSGRLSARSRPGSLIEIHGEGGRGRDWTNGCVALANPEMDDLFRRVAVGTPVTIIGADGGEGRFTTVAAALGEPTGGSRADAME